MKPLNTSSHLISVLLRISKDPKDARMHRKKKDKDKSRMSTRFHTGTCIM